MSSDGSIINGQASRTTALFACSACRSQKKGCDKAFPACSACVRLRRVCTYSSGPAPQVRPGDYQQLVERVAHLENEISQQRAISAPGPITTHGTPQLSSGTSRGYTPPNGSEFPSIFFLDVEIFQQKRIKAPKPRYTVPDDVLREIGDGLEVQTTIKFYFFSTFTWMAMVSKVGLHRDISVGTSGLEADVALLVLSMKLIHDRMPTIQNTPRTNLYIMTKEFFCKVESSGIGSIRLLQAGILITLYEMGHSIYPEAYLSVGHCGRLGQAIGLHDTAGIPQLALEPGSWDEMEERRRIWWAVFILDRYINVGNPTRPLALADARRGDYLPVDDKPWEEGERVASEPLFISSSTNITAAPFARLGQASHLLGHVLTHINDRGARSTPNVRLEEATQLSRAILALCSFLRPEVSSEATKICVPMGVCYSALILLYDYCTKARIGPKPLPAETELLQLGNAGSDSLVPEIVSYATHIQTILPYYSDQASPMVTNCLYCTARRLIGIGDAESVRAFTFIKETLHKLRSRWVVAGEYLKILEDIESTILRPGSVYD